MPRNFNEYIQNDGDGIVFAELSSVRPLPNGSRIMLINDGLMGFEAGRMFTVSTRIDCVDGVTHRYKGIGEAYLLDDEGNPHILKAGGELLNNSFILVERKQNEPEQEIVESITPSDEPEPDPTPIVLERVVTQVERGPEGVPGVRGSRGTQGPKGDRGEKGDKGDRGEIGPRGAQGLRGEKGERGEQGEKGEKGEEGPQGTQGIQGIQGVQGEAGEKGERGEPGPQGIAGPKGESGEKGERGERGEKGEKGIAGEKGERGERGEQGQPGTQGIQGVDGQSGPVGPKGDKGEQGPKGEPGIRGDRGEKGDKGDRGDVGEKGDKGDMPFLSVQQPLTLKNQRLSIDLAKLRKTIGSGGAPILYDGGGGLGEAFKFVSISGQAGLTAVQYDKETLTFVAGSNITLTTDPDSNSITINSLGGGGGTGLTASQGVTGATGSQGVTGATGPTGAIPTDYVVSFNGQTGNVYGISAFNGKTGNIEIFAGVGITIPPPLGLTFTIAANYVRGGATLSTKRVPEKEDWLMYQEFKGSRPMVLTTFGNLSYNFLGGQTTSPLGTFLKLSSNIDSILQESVDKYISYNDFKSDIVSSIPTGATGSQGPQGDQGIQGNTGPTGSQGPQGDTGEPGERGEPGIKGNTGNTGPTGSQGIQGIQGIQGNTGPTGSQGPQGDTGEPGDRGERGEPGIKGNTGNTGPTGSQGIQGIQGPTGPIGPTGSSPSLPIATSSITGVASFDLNNFNVSVTGQVSIQAIYGGSF